MSHDKRVWGSAPTWCLRSVGLRRGAMVVVPAVGAAVRSMLPCESDDRDSDSPRARFVLAQFLPDP
jgi:hypothetical protein